MGTGLGLHVETDKDGEYVMQTTTNLGLKKPETNEYVNIEDFNYNADLIDKLGAPVKEVVLTAAGWIGSSVPYMQTVAAPGATQDSEAIVVSALADGATEATQKAYSKAFGIVVSGTASLGNGTATFKVYKKPVTDIKIGLKGV